MDLTQFIGDIVGQGIWCILFVYFYISSEKKTEEREKSYQNIINQLTNEVGNIKNALVLLVERIEDIDEKLV